MIVWLHNLVQRQNVKQFHYCMFYNTCCRHLVGVHSFLLHTLRFLLPTRVRKQNINLNSSNKLRFCAYSLPTLSPKTHNKSNPLAPIRRDLSVWSSAGELHPSFKSRVVCFCPRLHSALLRAPQHCCGAHMLSTGSLTTVQRCCTDELVIPF